MTLPEAFVRACADLVGERHVLADPETLDAYATDFWRLIKGRAALVLRPGSTEEVAGLVRLAGEHRVALVPQAGNTSLVGGGVPDASGTQVVLSLARLDRVRSVDPAGDSVVVEAGCTLAAVQAAAEGVDRLFPLSLGSEGTCRIGGNLSTNAGGDQRHPLRHGARPGARARGGAGRRAGLERPADPAQGQHRLRPEAALPGCGRHARRHHRGGPSAVPATARAGDLLRRRRLARGRARALGPRPRAVRRAGHELRADQRLLRRRRLRAPAGRALRPDRALALVRPGRARLVAARGPGGCRRQLPGRGFRGRPRAGRHPRPERGPARHAVGHARRHQRGDPHRGRRHPPRRVRPGRAGSRS